jgi:tripartite ATP-independent transporter DctM subunit
VIDPIAIVSITAALMVVLILLGVHVAVTLGVMSFIGLWAISGQPGTAVNLLATTFFNALKSYEFGVIPLFVLMGSVFGHGLSEELFASANVLLRRVRGGLAMATVIGNAVFAAITGSSMASAAAFSKIAYPPMTRMGYDKRFALGCVAGSSILGMLIPPSILFIIYGILTQVSIGKLFIAGVVPGLLLTFIFCVGIAIMAAVRPGLVGRGAPTATSAPVALRAGSSDLATLFRPWPVLVLIVIVLGGIYRGFFTPNEAAAVGAVGAVLIAWAKRQLTWAKAKQAVWSVGITSGAIMLLLVMAQMYSRMVALSGVVQGVETWLAGAALPGMVVLGAVVVVVVAMGMLVDSASILLLLVPIAFPILTKLGYDPIWLGVVIVIATEMGLVTPPFGMSVFTVKASLGSEVTVGEIYSGAMPFLVMMALCLAIVIAFPGLSTWLVGYMQ